MELTLGLPFGLARSEIGTLPVRGPPCPTPDDTRDKRPGARGLGLSTFRLLDRSQQEVPP